MATDTLNIATTSWIVAPTCGLADFGTMMSINFNNWCFGATIIQ